MIITKENASIINTKNIYLHDDLITDIRYDLKQRSICFFVQKSEKKTTEIYTILFQNVSGFYASSFEYLPMDDYILDFEYLEPNIERAPSSLLIQLKNRFQVLYSPNSFDSILDNSFEVLFTLSNEKLFQIACERIEIDGVDM